MNFFVFSQICLKVIETSSDLQKTRLLVKKTLFQIHFLIMVQSTLLQRLILSALREDFDPLALVGALDYFGMPFGPINSEFLKILRGLS